MNAKATTTGFPSGSEAAAARTGAARPRMRSALRATLRTTLGIAALGLVAASVSTGLSRPAAAAQADAEQATLKVCASTKGAPYTTEDGRGFENRIAAVVAGAMGREAEFVWTDKPAIFLVRDMLYRGACDVLIGVDHGDPRVLTTDPYYRTGYVFVTRADRGLELNNWSDDDVAKLKRIAYQFHSPAEVMLKQTGLYEDNLIYQYSLINFRDRRNQFTQVPGHRLVAEVVKGEADVAVAFAPDVAQYVKASNTPLKMTVIDQNGITASGRLVPQQFDQAMAVRKDDDALRAELDDAIKQVQAEIEAILRDEGIPVLETQSNM